MVKFTYIGYIFILSILATGMMFPGGLFAQKGDSIVVWRDMDYIANADPWLASGSYLGLQKLYVKSISEISVSANKSNGNFVNYYQSDNSQRYNFSTSSYYRMNSKTVFRGEMSYSNFSGKHMQGSAFINPYANPLDIDEYADTTAGTKKTEYYHLLGAVNVQVASKWVVGGKLHYDAANYTKIKDLRHSNSLLFLDAELGANRELGKKDALGLSLGYKRRVESVTFSIAGNTDKQYISLINYGSFYGNSELFSDNGYTSDKNPAVNETKYATLFYSHSFSSAVTLLNAFTIGSRSGYFGKKGTTNILYTQHSADEYSYKGILGIQNKQNRHNITLNVGYNNLKNNLNIYQRETSTGGNTVIVYYGSNQVLRQNLTTAELKYQGFYKLLNDQPLWKVDVGGRFFRRDQTTIIYPYYRTQELNHYLLKANAERNYFFEENKKILLGISLAYGGGFGTAKEDGIYTSNSTQSAPASRDRYLYQEYEYFTKPRIVGGMHAGYSYNLLNGREIYCLADYSYTHAFQTDFVGKKIQIVSLQVGYRF